MLSIQSKILYSHTGSSRKLYIPRYRDASTQLSEHRMAMLGVVQ